MINIISTLLISERKNIRINSLKSRFTESMIQDLNTNDKQMINV